MALTHDGTNLTQVSYSYDNENRLSIIDHVDAAVEYAYNGTYMTGCTITISNGPVFTRTLVRDPNRLKCLSGITFQMLLSWIISS